MPGSKIQIRLAALTIVALATLGAATRAAAQMETILYSFGAYRGDANCPKGGPLVFDRHGNLYGTSTGGGPANDLCGGGAAFELTPAASGGWNESLIGYFNLNKEAGSPGQGPTAGVILDSAGNVYGAAIGQLYGDFEYQYFGEVFEISPTAEGGWQQETLVNGSPSNGEFPANALIADATGNLYGTAWEGGAEGGGVVFKLSRAADGTWIEQTLYNFALSAFTPNEPSGLVMDAAGNLYGVTVGGGADEVGVAYELSPQSSGEWTFKLLHTFAHHGDGAFPNQPMVFDAAGNLYGTTTSGGCATCYYAAEGTVFELTPESNGTWTERILHDFGKIPKDGNYPNAGVILDGAGNLYGTTAGGGSEGLGIAYELTPSGGVWTEKILHNFGTGKDGGSPYSALVLDSSGNLYGTTVLGGTYDLGTVFEITP
jgi:uncharacterized repeat protein (TIGR03803 family)